MATNYPGSLDTTTQLDNTWADADTTATAHPAAHANLADAVLAVETELGVTPKGTFSNVAARLNAQSTVRVTADQTFTTQVLANVTNMSFAVAANQDYLFRFILPYTAGTARGIGVGFTGPASPSFVYYAVNIYGHAANGTAANYFGIGAAFSSTIANNPTAGLTAAIVTIDGILSNGVNSGTLQLQARQGAGATAANAVIRKGAYGELYVN